MTEPEPPRPTTRGRLVAAEQPITSSRAAPGPTPSQPLPLGRIAFALILLAVGVGWLLHSLGVLEVPWDALLPVALIAVGAVLVAGSRTGRQSGLIALGIVLTLTTALVTAVDVPLIGGVGQRVIQPQSVAELEARYDLALGQLVIDLSGLRLQQRDRVEVEARVGMGELVVELPEGVNVQAQSRARLGDVQVLGEQASGFGPERIVTRTDRRRVALGASVQLDLSVGLGSVKVNQ